MSEQITTRCDECHVEKREKNEWLQAEITVNVKSILIDICPHRIGIGSPDKKTLCGIPDLLLTIGKLVDDWHKRLDRTVAERK